MRNHQPRAAPHGRRTNRSRLPLHVEQRPASLRVRRSLTMSSPDGSGRSAAASTAARGPKAGSTPTRPASSRGPSPAGNVCPSRTPVTSDFGASRSYEPQNPSVPLVTHAGAGEEDGVDDGVDAVPPGSP